MQSRNRKIARDWSRNLTIAALLQQKSGTSIMKRSTLFLGLLILALVSTGCGPAKLPVVRITGKVTFEGKPVEGASVIFSPMDSEGRLASGLTDAKGEFLVLTQGAVKTGVLPGHYRIAVFKYTLVDARNNPVVLSGESEPFDPSKRTPGSSARPVPKLALPDKYKNAETSGLTAEVTKRGPNVFAFDLTE